MRMEQIGTCLAVITALYVCRISVVWTRDLQVLWLFPKMNMVDFTLASSMGPLALAVEKSQQQGLLPGYGINITWMDSACDPKEAIGHFVKFLLLQKPDVVFGPPCTRAMVPVADLASFQNVPIFSWVSNMPDLDNKTVKSTLVRAIAPLSSLGELLIFFCSEMNWSKVSMISTVGESPEGLASFFKQAFVEKENFFVVREFGGVKDMANKSDIENMFNIIRQEARIIILVIPKTDVRHYMVVADDMGMTNGDFQFLYTERTVSDKAFLNEFTDTRFWKRGDGDDMKALRGYHNLLYFTYQYLTEWSLNSTESTNAALRVFGSDPTMPKPAPPDKYSRFLYDAFYLYALAFNETVHKNLTPDGYNIFEASKNKSFQEQTGDFLTNNIADRQSSFLIWDMDENNIFHQVAITSYTREGQLRCDIMAPILWGNGRLYNSSSGIYIPPDYPVCGFDNEKCTDDFLTEKIAPTVVILVMLAGFIAFLLVYRWWKNERMLYETLWKVKYTDLNFNIARGPISQMGISGTTGSQKSLNCSDNRSESSAGNMSSSNSTFKHDNMVMISQMFTAVAKLNGDLVAVRKVPKKSIREDKFLLKEMKLMKSLKHTNLATFHGACTEAPNICVLWEYCNKGSLEDILHNTDIKLEAMFQFSIAVDICTGLNYLHASELESHGCLKTTNCVIDSRWVTKLTDYGLRRFRKGEKTSDEVSEEKYYTNLFWTAPEVLRLVLQHEKVSHTKEADIFSLGVVLKQLLCKNFAYNEELVHQTPKDIIMKIANPGSGSLVRPHITEEFPEHHIIMMSFVHLIKACWAEEPSQRPTIKKVLRKVKGLSPLKSSGVVDNMLSLMERYSNRLEDLVSERTLQLEEEKRKTDTLLYRMLPKKVADDLKIGHHVQAEAFTDVTIYFSDIVGFTTLASDSTPMEIVEMLNLLYSQFDDVIQSFNVYKVETIGDAYMVVCGCPDPNPNHAAIMADMSLTLLDSVIHFVIPHRPESQLRIRIGLNSGPVVAGVVGNTMPRYCLFGNTVNLASRMESQGLPQKIQVSFFTYEILKNNPAFVMEARGLVEIKGKGKTPTYWLTGRAQTKAQEVSTNVESSAPGPQEVDGRDGDVTKQHTLRSRPTSDDATGGIGTSLTEQGSIDSTSHNRPGTSPKKSCRQTSASSISNTSCMSFENTQNTLTSITDIEEAGDDSCSQQQISGKSATGPNLDHCMTDVKGDLLGNSEASMVGQEQFWSDHFTNRASKSESNHNESIQFHNPNLEEHNLTKTNFEKDSFGMDHFGNECQQQDVLAADLITQDNFRVSGCDNGSVERVDNLDNNLGKNSLSHIDSHQRVFPATAFLSNSDGRANFIQQNVSPGCISQNPKEDGSRGGTGGSTPSTGSFSKARFNKTQNSGSPSKINYSRYDHKMMVTSSPQRHVKPKISTSSLYPRYKASFDDSTFDDMETDAFITNPQTQAEANMMSSPAYHHFNDSHSDTSGSTRGPRNVNGTQEASVINKGNEDTSMACDGEQYETFEHNPFIDKVSGPRQLPLNQSTKADNRRGSAPVLQDSCLVRTLSDRTVVSPPCGSHVIVTPTLVDRTSSRRHTLVCTDITPNHHQAQLSCVHLWDNLSDPKTVLTFQTDDQHTRVIGI